mmetsp:Transcript_22178/g.54921  ORF Transcript_22178/g.54921 Transcript_22178/m.54921 type:complete len:299 (+) Transcript_22178:103-999(+)|eukprot:CAMPEP_0116099750 /NCGR_PEP_ID=MMETSP0327-20121206/11934_1 /TAXON_ID=44447 /ORGANISM="Pseudo-nitzschia delicatissima, Strain B596" /LENGTH=298 /DNA_ID=CAMNT_0003591647 /DNA_START=28 /DNA_END=924 /DNA_ORIENTATION=+
MPTASDFGVVHARNENEKPLGESIIDDVFAKQSNTSIQLQWVIKHRWGKYGEPASPDVITIEASDRNKGVLRESGLELRRCARSYRKPVELVYRNPGSKKETLIAVIESIPINDPSSTTTNTTIFSPDPSFKGQVPMSGGSAGAKNGILSTLYPRATIKYKKSNTAYFEYATTVEMIEKGNESKVEQSMHRSDGETSPSSSTLYTSEEAPGPTGPQTIIRMKGTETAATSSSAYVAATIVYSTVPLKEQTLKITIAPGIDPCLIICLASDMMSRKALSEYTSEEEACLELCCSALCGC